MAFESITDFIAMGGYGVYVWVSFGITFAALAALVIHGLWVRKQLVVKCIHVQQRAHRLAQRAERERAQGHTNQSSVS